jgi:lipopolysaccharide transport system permease protein
MVTATANTTKILPIADCRLIEFSIYLRHFNFYPIEFTLKKSAIGNRQPAMKETVYTSNSQLSTPRIFLQELIEDLKSTREIGWRFFLRNLRSQYRQSWFGYLWLLIPPLGTTVIWVYLSKAKILNVNTMDVPYPIFVLTGMFLWQTFVESLVCPLQQLQASRLILTKIKAPHEAFILAGLGGIIFNLIARMFILVVAFIWYGVSFQTTWLLFPLGVISLLMLGLAIGWLITPLGMLYTDVSSGINIIVTFWFFITPIVYSNNDLAIVKFNPLTPLLITTRNWLTNGIAAPESGFFLVTILAFFIFLFSWILYRLAKPHLIVRLSS